MIGTTFWGEGERKYFLLGRFPGNVRLSFLSMKNKGLRNGHCYRLRLCCFTNGILISALEGLRYSENVDVTI